MIHDDVTGGRGVEAVKIGMNCLAYVLPSTTMVEGVGEGSAPKECGRYYVVSTLLLLEPSRGRSPIVGCSSIRSQSISTSAPVPKMLVTCSRSGPNGRQRC